MIPADLARFGSEAARRLERVVGVTRVVGVYFVGSVALEDYLPNQSDIDIVAVIDRTISDDEKREVAEALSHPHLECPTRGLEFVLYAREAVEVRSGDASFELNLNTGPRMENHVGVDASAEPRFWFVIDRAIAHQFGVSIVGPPAAEVFAPISRRLVLEAMAESITWHRANEKLGDSSVLNACRAWRYAEDGELGSKSDAAKWARKRSSDPGAVDAALKLRGGANADLPAVAVATLLDDAQAAVTAALT